MVQNRSPGNDIAWQQALDWVMLMRDGMLDASAEQRLLDWLDQSPDHIESFRQACAVWQATGAVTPLDPGRPRSPHAAHGRAAAHTPRLTFAVTLRSHSATNLYTLPLRIARACRYNCE
ncbi:hypothetical protein OJJOAM_003245 [Cupriavidus sp. H18C1]|uniref:FecR/PupR family sigma factor regulator n=1 Tax=Cupriavidus sp. H18C1 TaxID=3241601 RepID=UPI003BB8CF15